MTEKRDLYFDLGIPFDAGQDGIKTAYRELAKRHHPDKGGDPATFQRITEAYEVLSDPDARAHYDATGTFSTKATNDAALIALLDNIFHKVLAAVEQRNLDPMAFDFVAGMRELLDDGDRLASEAIVRMRKDVTKNTLLASRFTAKEGVTNHFAVLLHQKTELLQRQIATAEEAIIQHRLAREYLSGVTFNRPYLRAPEPVQDEGFDIYAVLRPSR